MDRTNARSVGINIITTLGLLLLSYFLKYILNVYLANHFTPAYYGDFSLAIRILYLSASITLLGTNDATHHFFSKNIHEQKIDQAFSYLQWNFYFIFRAFIVCVMLGFLLFIVMSLLNYFHVKDFASYHLAIYMLWIAPASALVMLFFSFLVGVGKNRISNFISGVMRSFLLLAFFFITISFLNVGVSDFFVLIVVVSATFITLLTQAVILRETLGAKFVGLFKTMAQKPVLINPAWQNVSLNLARSSMIYLVIVTLDLFIVEIVLPDEASVGFYAAILTVSGIINVLASACYQTLRPIVSECLKSKQGMLRLKKKLGLTNLFFLIIGSICSILLIVFGEKILAHFGIKYIQVYSVLVISILTALIYSSGTSASILLMYSGDQKLPLIINTCELVLLVILGITLTYKYGIMGMAIASLVATSTKVLMLLFMVHKKLQLHALMII
jgi:O-antigen/teichoic acid export membrane protein